MRNAAQPISLLHNGFLTPISLQNDPGRPRRALHPTAEDLAHSTPRSSNESPSPERLDHHWSPTRERSISHANAQVTVATGLTLLAYRAASDSRGLLSQLSYSGDL